MGALQTQHYSLPIATLPNQSLIVTSDYGPRQAPCVGASTNHLAIDIGIPVGTPLLSTEDSGRVTTVRQNGGKAGKYVAIEYDRPDGSKLVVRYLHMSKIEVKEGDIVHAGQQIGLSGNTGIGTGAHLHYDAKIITPAGEERRIDPKEYIAEIELRGNIDTKFILKATGRDAMVIAKDKVKERLTQAELEAPPQTLVQTKDIETRPSKKKQEETLFSAMNAQGGGSQNLFTALLAMFMILNMKNMQNGMSAEDTMSKAPDIVKNREIDITDYVPQYTMTKLVADSNGKMALKAFSDGKEYTRTLTEAEKIAIVGMMNSEQYTESEKTKALSSFVERAMGSAIAVQQKVDIASALRQNFEELTNHASEQSVRTLN